MTLEHEAFPHLTLIEWDALHRLAAVSGESLVTSLLSSGTSDQHRLTAHEFMQRELAEARKQASNPKAPQSQVVKLETSTYSGEGPNRMPLNRWFCEVDIAMGARLLQGEFAQTNFLLSRLSGKAKAWALGKRVNDASAFPTVQSLKEDLRLAFEPPQDETQHRAAFLNLKQGRTSMRDYIQRARHLVSCVVTHPIDMATQVHVFMSGMREGYPRFHLTQDPPDTLEQAFVVALREDYNVTASRSSPFTHPVEQQPSDPEPMEVDAIDYDQGRRTMASPGARGRFSRGRGGSSQRPLVCFRCRKPGHRAAECRAPAPVSAASVEVASDGDAAFPGQSKNGDHQ